MGEIEGLKGTVSMARRVFLLTAALAALRLGDPDRAAAVFDPPSSAIVIAADEGVYDLDQPFRPPVVFTLQPSGAGALFLPGSGNDFLNDVQRWQIQILNFDDKKVAFIQGVGRPTATRIDWDGVGSDGTLLRDGFYTVRLVWTDRVGVTRHSEDVKVGLLTPPGMQDFIGPQVRLAYTTDGLTIRLAEELTFAPAESDLLLQAHETLNRIAGFLRRYPKNRLLVLGHADATGSQGANQTLSLKRAESIYRFLLARGVAQERMSAQGMGVERPVASNSTAEGRRKNRRVEILILRAG